MQKADFNMTQIKYILLASQIEKSDVLPCVRNLLSYTSNLTQGLCLVTSHWLYRTSQNFLVKQRHKNVRMTSVLIKMEDVKVGYLKVKMDLFKRWHPKVCKKKNPTCVCGYVRQFCPSGHCLASLGRAS